MLSNEKWYKAAKVNDIPANSGACVYYKGQQIAIFNFDSRSEWYACQNFCGHKKQMVLSRGIIGDKNGEPKVACPLHKKSFSLKSGKNLNGDDLSIRTFPVKVEAGYIYLQIND